MLFSYAFFTSLQGVCLTFYYICYTLENSWIEQYKCFRRSWPWKDEKRKNNWDELYWRTVFLCSLNLLVIGPITVYCPYFLLDIDVPFDYSLEGIPGSNKMIAQIIFCMLIEDII